MGMDTGHKAAEGTFDFESHWRPTVVETKVSLSGSEKHKVQLEVSNNRGKNLRYNFQCVNGADRGLDPSVNGSSTPVVGTASGNGSSAPAASSDDAADR